jgi:glutamyl-tRNA reductase
MPIVVLGINYRTAPVEVRERVAFGEAVLPQALDRLRQSGIADEAVILSTCNRVELYVAMTSSARSGPDDLIGFLREFHGYQALLPETAYYYDEPNSVTHLFRVACGLDSMVLGETEILGQLKHAYDIALRHQHTRSRLNKAFQKAFNVAKQVRTETQIQRGSVSVANVAVELAEKIFETLKDHRVMVIGAGDTSEKTARALISRGVEKVVVTNRTFERAQALAAELGGEAVSFLDWPKVFEPIDIVISSTAAPDYVVDRHCLGPLMKLRKHRPLLLIDIAVPRDIEPEVNYLENVFLYNIDDLRAIADDYLKNRQEEIKRCETIIQEKVRTLLQPQIPPQKPSPGGLALENSR